MSWFKGLLAYYAKWIQNFFEKISILKNLTFPLSDEIVKSIKSIKDDIAASVRASVDPEEILVVAANKRWSLFLSNRRFIRSLCRLS